MTSENGLKERKMNDLREVEMEGCVVRYRAFTVGEYFRNADDAWMPFVFANLVREIVDGEGNAVSGDDLSDDFKWEIATGIAEAIGLPQPPQTMPWFGKGFFERMNPGLGNAFQGLVRDQPRPFSFPKTDPALLVRGDVKALQNVLHSLERWEKAQAEREIAREKRETWRYRIILTVSVVTLLAALSTRVSNDDALGVVHWFLRLVGLMQ